MTIVCMYICSTSIKVQSLRAYETSTGTKPPRLTEGQRQWQKWCASDHIHNIKKKPLNRSTIRYNVTLSFHISAIHSNINTFWCDIFLEKHKIMRLLIYLSDFFESILMMWNTFSLLVLILLNAYIQALCSFYASSHFGKQHHYHSRYTFTKTLIFLKVWKMSLGFYVKSNLTNFWRI